MVEKCANAACGELFTRYRNGKLFSFEIEQPGEDGKFARVTQWYWLCEPCSQQMVLYSVDNKAVVLEEREKQPKAAA